MTASVFGTRAARRSAVPAQGWPPNVASSDSAILIGARFQSIVHRPVGLANWRTGPERNSPEFMLACSAVRSVASKSQQDLEP